MRAAAGRAHHGRRYVLVAAAKLALHAAVLRVDKRAVDSYVAARKVWVVETPVDRGSTR